MGTSGLHDLRRQIVTRQAYHPRTPGRTDRGQDHGNGAGATHLRARRDLRPPPAPEARRRAFARRLYERVADKDLAAASAEQRAAAALALLAFARRRLPGVAKVRVFNPTIADHGFESRHTIVQIVNDDMPFLVDSIANELNRREIGVHLLAHPVMPVRRDLDGDLLRVRRSRRARAVRIADADRDRPPGRSGRSSTISPRRSARVLAEVRLAVEDWRAMRQACLDAIEDLAPGRKRRLAEHEEFLRWLEANHFTFLGHRRYRYVEDAAQPGGIRYELMPGSALGILRRDEVAAVRGRAGRRRGDVALRARAADSC